jgi:hypothetical protein
MYNSLAFSAVFDSLTGSMYFVPSFGESFACIDTCELTVNTNGRERIACTRTTLS